MKCDEGVQGERVECEGDEGACKERGWSVKGDASPWDPATLMSATWNTLSLCTNVLLGRGTCMMPKVEPAGRVTERGVATKSTPRIAATSS